MIPPKPATRPSAFAPTARPDDHRNISAVAAIDARACRGKHPTVVMVNWLTECTGHVRLSCCGSEHRRLRALPT
jgi:hypothetical protein